MYSGASDYFINQEDLAKDFEEFKTPTNISVTINGIFITVRRSGQSQIKTNKGIAGFIEDVLYFPEEEDLLYLSKIQRVSKTVTFDKKGVKIIKGGKRIIQITPVTGLEVLGTFGVTNAII